MGALEDRMGNLDTAQNPEGVCLENFLHVFQVLFYQGYCCSYA